MNALGNNLEIYVEYVYGYSSSTGVTLQSLETLTDGITTSLGALAATACADDPKAAAAVDASKAITTFLEALPVSGNLPDLSAQTSNEEGLVAALKAAIAASPCASALTTAAGSATTPTGMTLATGAVTGADLVLPVTSGAAFPAIAIDNVASNGVSFGSIKVDYADGSSVTIDAGEIPVDGASTFTQGSFGVASQLSLVVDIDAKPLASITLTGAQLSCPQPGGSSGSSTGTSSGSHSGSTSASSAGSTSGTSTVASTGDMSGGGGTEVCTGSVTILGLAKGNGLIPLPSGSGGSGCGSSTSSTSSSQESSGGSVSGTVSGLGFSVKSTFGILGTNMYIGSGGGEVDGGQIVGIVLASRSGLTCTDFESIIGQGKTAFASTDSLDLTLGTINGNLSLGTYDISTTPSGNFAKAATLRTTSAACASVVNDAATSGSVTLTAVDASRVAGTYDLTFGTSGSYSGAFDITPCPESQANGATGPACQ